MSAPHRIEPGSAFGGGGGGWGGGGGGGGGGGPVSGEELTPDGHVEGQEAQEQQHVAGLVGDEAADGAGEPRDGALLPQRAEFLAEELAVAAQQGPAGPPV